MPRTAKHNDSQEPKRATFIGIAEYSCRIFLCGYCGKRFAVELSVPTKHCPCCGEEIR